MATYLRLFPKPYVRTEPNIADYKAFHINPGQTFEEIEELVSQAAYDEEVQLKVVLPDLGFPVPFGFRKCDWSAWMLHPLPDHESV